MADYDWFSLDCERECYRYHDHNCPEHPDYEKYLKRNQGYVYDSKIKAYFCRRGCGTLVWDTEAHSQNVCREFNPIAAS